MFDLTHLIALGIMVVIVVLLSLFKDKFKEKTPDMIFRYTLGSLLFIFETGFHIWVISRGEYTVDMIPLTGVCAITNILTIIGLFSNNSKLMSISFYWAHIGAFFSLLFVDVTYVPPHFRFFHYFIVHFGFLLGNIYFYLVDKIHLKRKYINLSCLIILGLTLALLPINIMFDKNFYYLLESPVKEVSDLFGLPLYTILWIITIALMLNGVYYMYRGIDKLRHRVLD